MKYKMMKVWCCGNEKAKTAKTEVVLGCIGSTLLSILHIMFFVSDFGGDTPLKLWQHLGLGIGFSALMGIFTFGMFALTIESFKNIKLNKIIPFYMYEIKEFAKIGEIPEDKFVFFSDERGVVLALKEYEKESKICAKGAKYFHEFEDYYNKHAVEVKEYNSLSEEK